MLVNVFNQQSHLNISTVQVQQIVQHVIQLENQTGDEVDIYFVDTPTICQLHDQFFQDPSPTDCISFPMDEDSSVPYRILGEVFVCPETAITYAAQHQLDAYDETMLYIVHGLLHLMGYDDIEEDNDILMRQAEKRHMQALKKSGLYLTH